MIRSGDEKFPPQHRIARSSDFRAIYAAGRRVDSARFVLFGRKNSLEYHRIGLTVSRKVGRAVVRNRIKRLFREVFRKSSAEIPCHFDFVVNAKRKCADGSYVVLREEFLSAARKICRKF